MDQKVLTIDITFPEYCSKEVMDFGLYQAYYELYTCHSLLEYVKNNYPELYMYMFEDMSDDIELRHRIFEFRNTLGSYAKNFDIDEKLKFAVYSLINAIKEKLKEYLNIDEIRLQYTRNHFKSKEEQKYFDEFISCENDSKLTRQ